MTKRTRTVKVANLLIGGGHPISVQSMCATKTQDLDSTLAQVKLLEKHGADLVRIAADNEKDVKALAFIRDKTDIPLAVDVQENYRLVEKLAPLVDKVRYNPGHLHHLEKTNSDFEKVSFIVNQCQQHNCAIRIGINFGSLNQEASEDHIEFALKTASEHINYMEKLAFENFLVSLKSSDPNDVIEVNKAFAKQHPNIPLHLGVTEAGMLPVGEAKTRAAFEHLLPQGIGDTIRVSLTLPYEQKYKEVLIGKRIIDDVNSGTITSQGFYEQTGLNIIACPSCSRVENEAFVELAAKVQEATKHLTDKNITIAVMGCRVNGPGESDDADFGLWCAPQHVNFKKQGKLIGTFAYDEIIPRLLEELSQS